MTLTKISQASLNDFYAAIRNWEQAYQHSSFFYVAVKEGDQFEILQAAVRLSAELSDLPSSHFASENIKAGHYTLSELGLDYKNVISALLSGSLNTPAGILRFSPQIGQHHHSLFYTPVHPTTQRSQSRFNVVKLGSGQPTVDRKQPLLDWELRAAPTPFDSIGELLLEYNLGALFGDVISVEIIATPVMRIMDSSKIVGSWARRCAPKQPLKRLRRPPARLTGPR
jgi:hypothetical protein